MRPPARTRRATTPSASRAGPRRVRGGPGPRAARTTAAAGGPRPGRRAPRVPARLPISSAREAVDPISSAREAVDLLLPLVEQASPLDGRAELLEVVVDQLDLREPRRLLRHLRTPIRRHLELLAARPQRLGRRGERPVHEAARAFGIARAAHDAHRADLVARPLAGSHAAHRKA